MRNPSREPSLHNDLWLKFLFAKEANSAFASTDWQRYRTGLRNLARRHEKLFAKGAVQREFAEDVFFCATHWKHSARVVRRALADFLKSEPSASTYAYAAAEFWKWASATSPEDLPEAERMVARAKAQLPGMEVSRRVNLERMFAAVVGDPPTRRG